MKLKSEIKEIKEFLSDVDLAKKLEILVLNTEEPCVVVNPELRVISFNKQFETLYARYYSKTIYTGSCIIDYTQQKSAETLTKIYKEVLSGIIHRLELEVDTSDASHYTFVLTYKPAYDEEGNIIAAFVTAGNITEKKETEQRLNASEDRFRSIIEHNGDIIALTDKKGKLIYVSTSFERLIGLKADKMLEKQVFDIIQPEFTGKSKHILKRVLVSPGVALPFKSSFFNQATRQYIHLEGFLTNLLHDKNVEAIVANFKDVTEGVLADAKLKLAQRRFETLIDHNYDGIVLRDKDLKIIYGNTSSEKIMGWTFEDKLGKDFTDKTHPDDLEKVKQNQQNVLNNPGISFPCIFRTLHKAGHYVWVERVMTNMLEDEAINAIVANFRDISAQKKIQERLAKSEKRYRALVENAGDCIAIIGLDGKPNYVSPSIKKVLGYSEEEALELVMLEIVHEEDRDAVAAVMQESFNNPGVSIKGHTARLLHKDGSWRWYDSIVVNMLHDPLINGFIDNFRDVTEKILTQQAREFDQNNLDALINTTNDLMWSISTEGKLISTNRAFNEMVKLMSGYDVVIGKDAPSKGFSEQNIERWKLYYSRTFSGESFTTIEYSELPEENWSEISFHPIYKGEKIIGAACYSRNITERKIFERKLERNTSQLLIAKNELEHSESRLKQAQSMTHIGNWEVDLTTNLCIWSDECYRIYGLEPGSHPISIQEWKSFVHPEDLPEFEKELERIWEGKHDTFYRHRIIRKNGEVRHVLNESRYELDEKQTPIGLYGVVLDLTESVEAQEEILKSHQLLQKLTNKVPLVVFQFKIDKNGTRTLPFVSSTIMELIPDIDTEQLKQDASSLFSKIHPEDIDAVNTSIQESFIELTTWDKEFRIISKNNDLFWIRGSSIPERAENGETLWFGYFQNNTEKKLAEEKIQHAKERYDIVAKATNDAIWDWDISTDELYWNDGHKILFGYNEANTAQSIESLTDRAHDEDKKKIMEGLTEAFLSKDINTWQAEFRYLKKDGSYASVLNKAFLMRNFDGNVYRIIGALQDITVQKMANEKIRLAKERYDFVAKATNDAIYDWNLITNKTVRSGDGLKTLFGYEPEEAAAEKDFWKNRFHPEDFEASHAILKKALRDPTINACNQEYRFRKADGNYAYVYDKGFIIRDKDGKAIRMIGATQDVTRTKEAEFKLKELNDHLEKRAQELAVSNTELEQFAYIASHDLQEPLRMVTSFLTLLEKKYKDQLDATAQQYIHFATDGATRMRKLILDLLDYSRVGRQTHTKEKIDINEVLFEAIKLNSGLIDEKKAIINWNTLPVITASKTGLLQIFQNLLANALKYQIKGNLPFIEISASETDKYWQFSVSDNGIGIEEKYFEKIFIVFQRLHNKDEFSGTGIGLSICKKIVENHEGRFWVESNYGKGSKFYFTIAKNN